MSLISISDFTGELDIANSNNSNVIPRIQKFIDKYELKFIKEVLGEWDEYTEAVEAQPIEEDWQTLQDMLKPLAACFVYYWYQRDAVTKTTGLGEKVPKGENAEDASPAAKMERAWNEMAAGLEEVYDFLNRNIASYPGWSYYTPCVPRINTFNL
jgi:hypothetical protein